MDNIIQTVANEKHPRALVVFFLTEMWERYGFYVIQTLLALYLALHYQWSDQNVYALVGSFTALTYLSPIVGGWIADQWLGQKSAVLLGAVILFFNYCILSIMQQEKMLIFALAGIAVGTGLLKPNISSLLGNQYSLKSSKKEQGFTIFYMGITTGIIFGTILPSQLNDYWGWAFSFASAAFGMIISFLTFYIGIKRYSIKNYQSIHSFMAHVWKTLFLIMGLWMLCYTILFYPYFADLLFLSVIIFAIFYLIYAMKHEDPAQAKKTRVIGFLCIISTMFWAFYFQMFMSLTLFLVRVVNPTLWGIAFPPPYYVAIQSVGILLFGYWISLNKRKPNHHDVAHISNKFLMAMVLLCFAYALITFVATMSPGNMLLSPWYFIPAYLLISLAELLLSPVGLAAITTLACRHKVSTMMGIFFVSLGIGGFLSGKLAMLTATTPGKLSIKELKWHYAHSFSHLLMVLLAATLVALLINIGIKRVEK